MHIKPKKKLGQNFLVDKNVLKKIIDTCEISPSDTVLEIGSGRGDLTEGLALKAGKLIALELDSQLCDFLNDKFKDSPNIKIINRDILKFDIDKYFLKAKDKIKVVGNIPYYITSPIIEHLFKYKNKIDSIFLTVQKEFGERIVADPGSKDYGAFSCFVQFYSRPEIIFSIKRGSFYPVPKVDSCFLKIAIRGEAPYKIKDVDLFFKIIRLAFNQRRKTLRNSLKNVLTREELDSFFVFYNIPAGTRPESLGLQHFAYLANHKKT